MITDLLTKLFKWYNSDKYFPEFYPQHDDKNTNNVAVTVHTADVTHADEITNVIITSHHVTEHNHFTHVSQNNGNRLALLYNTTLKITKQRPRQCFEIIAGQAPEAHAYPVSSSMMANLGATVTECVPFAKLTKNSDSKLQLVDRYDLQNNRIGLIANVNHA